jgi:hypothetical protein
VEQTGERLRKRMNKSEEREKKEKRKR